MALNDNGLAALLRDLFPLTPSELIINFVRIHRSCKPCPVVSPAFLCGSDNHTYSSYCRLDYHNCIQEANVKIACKGFCPCRGNCVIQFRFLGVFAFFPPTKVPASARFVLPRRIKHSFIFVLQFHNFAFCRVERNQEAKSSGRAAEAVSIKIQAVV